MDANATTSQQGSSSSSATRPSSLSSLSLSSSSYSSHHAPPSITNFPILVLTVLGILTTSLLLLAYYVFVIRCCLNWHHRNGGSSSSTTTSIPGARGRRQRQRAATSSGTALPDPVSAAAEPRGLEESAIRALPAFRYSGSRTNKEDRASECAVCLGEFEDGDRVRLLPGCLHVFHVACIDTWLHANANCPLCRAHIVAGHCLNLLPLPLLPPPLQPADQTHDQEEVTIQLVELVPGGGAEQQDQATTQAQQRGAATAAAPETAGETAAADNQLVGVVVVGGHRQTVVSACCHIENEIDLGSEVGGECTPDQSKDGDVVVPLPPSAGGEVHLQIQNILQGNDTRRSHRDDEHDSDSTSSVFSSV